MPHETKGFTSDTPKGWTSPSLHRLRSPVKGEASKDGSGRMTEFQTVN